jgi:hypothetical protein
MIVEGMKQVARKEMGGKINNFLMVHENTVNC